MNAFNRGFLALLALAWIAALAGIIWLIWDQSRVLDITSSSVSLNFDVIADTQAEKILATIVAVALMLPALLLFVLELKPSRRSDAEVVRATDNNRGEMQSRIDSLEKDLKEERSRNESLRNRDRDERPATSGHRGWHLFPRH